LLPSRLLAAPLAAVALLFPSLASAAVAPPPPTGPAPVGLTRLTLVDRQRTEHLAVESGGPRLIPLRVWYPASRPGRRPAETFTSAERMAYETEFGLPAGALDGMGATATRDARPAPGRHPVLLLSHGFGMSTAFHTAQATDLASRGYVVIGIDHPGDADMVDAGHGRLRHMNPAGVDTRLESFAERVADEHYVLGHLGAVGRLDRTRIGAFGHSIGGATSAQAMLEDRRIRAGVDIDGALFGSVIDAGLDRPFGVLLGELPFEAYEGMDSFLSHSHGPRVFERQGTTGHQGFTDVVWLVPQLGADPSAFALGTVDADVAVAQQRRFLAGFFARHL
jgi:predicted dienelactone hydrolase